MSKVVSKFESMVVEWGTALNELSAADAMCRSNPNGWPDKDSKELQNLDTLAKKVDHMRGPMQTALANYAKHIAKLKSTN